MQKIRGRQTGACGLQVEARKAVKDDFGKLVEIADEESEEADIERLLDQPRDDVRLARKRPEQAGERDVERDQRLRQKSDITTEEAKAGIDIGREHIQELVDDAAAAHPQRSLDTLGGEKNRARFSAQASSQA